MAEATLLGAGDPRASLYDPLFDDIANTLSQYLHPSVEVSWKAVATRWQLENIVVLMKKYLMPASSGFSVVQEYEVGGEPRARVRVVFEAPESTEWIYEVVVTRSNHRDSI